MFYFLLLHTIHLVSSSDLCTIDSSELEDFKLILTSDPSLLEQILCTYKTYLTHTESRSSKLQDPPLRPTDFSEDSYTALLSKSLQLFVQERIKPNNKRYPTIIEVFRLLIARNAKILVETGTARSGNRNCEGDGCSTVIFGLFAKLSGGFLHSVDIDDKACQEARTAVEGFKESVSIVNSDSVKFLGKFDGGLIDFLYLDSYDFSESNPGPSQEHHRKEIEAAYNNLHTNSIVMIDDCRLIHGGKCKLVNEYMMKRNWTLAVSEYQQIFIYQQ